MTRTRRSAEARARRRQKSCARAIARKSNLAWQPYKLPRALLPNFATGVELCKVYSEVQACMKLMDAHQHELDGIHCLVATQPRRFKHFRAERHRILGLVAPCAAKLADSSVTLVLGALAHAIVVNPATGRENNMIGDLLAALEYQCRAAEVKSRWMFAYNLHYS
jgi:hypothetical protein